MSSEGHVRTIEVEGHKFEVDMRSAKKIENFKVGDRVKTLIKTYSGYQSHPGCIVGIDAFKNLPTIIIAYIEDPLSYSGDGGKVAFAYLNSQSKDIELCPMEDDDIMPTRQTIVGYFERAIATKLSEVEQMKERKEFFLRQYGTAVGVGAPEEATTAAD